MTDFQPFWDHVATKIGADYTWGHPASWNKSTIGIFLARMENELNELASQDREKALKCGAVQRNDGSISHISPIKYHAFRTIFQVGGNSGKVTTRHQFAILLGADSFEQYVDKHHLFPAMAPPLEIAAEVPGHRSPQQPPRRTRAYLLPLLLLTGSCVYLIFSLAFTPKEEPLLLFRNEDGLAVLDLANRKVTQLVQDREQITGLDFDYHSGKIYWSNYEGYHMAVSRVDLIKTSSNLRVVNHELRFAQTVNAPCGIALDPSREVLYVANHGDSTISKFDYSGRVLDKSVAGNLGGKPSSIEIDSVNQMLYWTDVSNHRIGRMDLRDKVVEPNYLVSVGEYPDGLALDPMRNKLFWAATNSSHIGWVHLPTGQVHLQKIPHAPSAVEVHPNDDYLYVGTNESNRLFWGRISTDTIVFDPADFLEFHRLRPGIMRFIDHELMNQ